MSANGIHITDQYAAGFIDGEGSVGIYLQSCVKMGREGPKRYTSKRPQIAVSNTNFEVIRAIQTHFGCGALVEINPRLEHHLPQLKWQVVCQDALRISKRVLSYSIVKRQKLQEILDYYRGKSRFGCSKLTEAEVLDLRRRYDQGVSFRELGSRFKITDAHASRIAHGKAWKHLIKSGVRS